jgi:hypothetical protein
MTRFWREGHYRTSIYGDTHWVEGHWVTRDDWDHYEADTPPLYHHSIWQLSELRASRSATSRLVIPNADCPVCGQPVFFYQNEHGSRVYFDELCPPWPKHPCTDKSEYVQSVPGPTSSTRRPTLRYSSQISEIENLLDAAHLDPSIQFWEEYRIHQWDAWRVDGRFKGGAGVLLVLSDISSPKVGRLFLACQRFPKAIARGAFVFLHDEKISFFDAEQMQPVETKARRILNANAFIDELVSSEDPHAP